MVFHIMGYPTNLVLAVGSMGAMTEIGRRGLMPRLLHCWPAYAGTAAWILLNMYWGFPSEDNLFSSKWAILACSYAIPAGYLVHQYSRTGGERWAIFAYACLCAGLALMLLYIIRVGNVTIQVQTENGLVGRSAENDNGISYLRFFQISNVMMNSISFTIFGFSLPVLAFMRVRWPSLAVVAVAYGLCMIGLQRLLTRSAFVAGTLACIITFFLVMRKEGGYLTRRRRFLVIALVAAAAVVAGGALLSIPEFSILLDRISQSGDDSRQVLWREAWDNILNKPWGGGTYNMVTGGWAHNIILDFALYNGFLGAVCMTLVFSLAWFRCWQLSQRKKAMDSPLTVAMITVLLAITIVEMFTPPFYGLILFVYIFIGYSSSWLDEDKRTLKQTI